MSTPTDAMSFNVFYQYKDPLISTEFDAMLTDILATGIYKGALLTKIDDANVSVSPARAVITDGTYTVPFVGATSGVVSSVSAATPYIIFRWTYNNVHAWYPAIIAVALGSILSTDLVIGKAVYTGPVLTSFDYGSRSIPLSFATFLKVDPTVPASMRVLVRGGWCSYGLSKLSIQEQQSSLITAPVSNPRIDLIYIDSSGIVQVQTGVEAASPTAPAHTGKIVLAEILLQTASTTITADMITDTRPFVNLGGSGGGGGSVEGFSDSFVNGDLTAGIIVFNHGLSSLAIGDISLINDLNMGYKPDSWRIIDGDNVEVNISSYGVISGTHTVVITAKV